MENPLPCTEKYPYLLNTGRGTVGQWHTQSRTKEVRFIEDASVDEAYIYINESFANDNNIKENDYVNVKSINGQSAKFFAKITDKVKYDEFFAPIHYIECNRLTPSIYDSFSKEPSYKSTPVMLKRAGGNRND